MLIISHAVIMAGLIYESLLVTVAAVTSRIQSPFQALKIVFIVYPPHILSITFFPVSLL